MGRWADGQDRIGQDRTAPRDEGDVRVGQSFLCIDQQEPDCTVPYVSQDCSRGVAIVNSSKMIGEMS